MSVHFGTAPRHSRRGLSRKSSETTGRFECFGIGVIDFQASSRLIPMGRGTESRTKLRHFARDAHCVHSLGKRVMAAANQSWVQVQTTWSLACHLNHKDERLIVALNF